MQQTKLFLRFRPQFHKQILNHYFDAPVMKGRKSFFKLYHLRLFITGTSICLKPINLLKFKLKNKKWT